MFNTKRNYITEVFTYIDASYNGKDVSLSVFKNEKDDTYFFSFLVNTVRAIEGYRFIEEWVATKLNDTYDPMNLDGTIIKEVVNNADSVYLMTIKYTYSNEKDVDLEYLSKNNALNMIGEFQDSTIQKGFLTIGEPNLKEDDIVYPYSLKIIKDINERFLKNFTLKPCGCMIDKYGKDYKFEPIVNEDGSGNVPCECGRLGYMYNDTNISLAQDDDGNYFLMKMYDSYEAGAFFCMYSGNYVLKEDALKILNNKVDYHEFQKIKNKYKRHIKEISDSFGTVTHIDVAR